jgi:hypothetical protein
MADDLDEFFDKLEFYMATGARFGPQHRPAAKERLRAAFDSAVNARIKQVVVEDIRAGGKIAAALFEPRGGPQPITEGRADGDPLAHVIIEMQTQPSGGERTSAAPRGGK